MTYIDVLAHIDELPDIDEREHLRGVIMVQEKIHEQDHNDGLPKRDEMETNEFATDITSEILAQLTTPVAHVMWTGVSRWSDL